MKNKILSIVLLLTFTFGSILSSQAHNPVQNLSKKEMSQITGGGCQDWEHWGNVADFCFWTLNIVGYYIAVAIQDSFLESCLLEQQSGGGGTSQCPNGSGYDTFENCQSGGGRWMGDNCCEY
jgi:bacteriocin-like protein